MTNNGDIIEVQGTAEKTPFSRQPLNQMLDLAKKGLQSHFALQLKLLGEEIA